MITDFRVNTSKQADYHADIVVPGSARHATDAISQVSSWWTENTKGNSKNTGDEFLVPFGETYSRFKVTDYIPGKKIRWLVLDCNLHWMKNKKEWKDTEILWEISSSGDSTRIDMTHIGLVPGIECFEDCNKGWDHYVKKSLYKLLTEGCGEPDHKDHSAQERQ
jgi:hypothetical protein